MARILIADDEGGVRYFLQESIRMMGHSTVEALNGKEALAIFKNDPVDLSIVDINMPEMDGLKFLHRAKEIDPHAVVIIITGHPSAESVVETIEEDGYTYMAKPIDRTRLEDLIQRGLELRSNQS